MWTKVTKAGSTVQHSGLVRRLDDVFHDISCLVVNRNYKMCQFVHVVAIYGRK